MLLLLVPVVLLLEVLELLELPVELLDVLAFVFEELELELDDWLAFVCFGLAK